MQCQAEGFISDENSEVEKLTQFICSIISPIFQYAAVQDFEIFYL